MTTFRHEYVTVVERRATIGRTGRARLSGSLRRSPWQSGTTLSTIPLLHRNEIDLIVVDDAPPWFARHIVLDGRRVHRSDARAEHAFRRDVQLRAADNGPFLDRMRRSKMEAP